MTVPDTIEKRINEYFTQDKVQNNWLVGRGVMLAPPISGVVVQEGSRWRLRVTGNDGHSAVDHGTQQQHEFLIDDAVIGRFRPQLTLVDNASDVPIYTTLTHLQPKRLSLLQSVPLGESITRAQLIARNPSDEGEPQTDAPRRWRELRLEYGMGVADRAGGKVYSRTEDTLPVRDPMPRPDMKAINRYMVPAMLARGDQLKCAKCERDIDRPGTKPEQIVNFPGVCDHRRPIAYGGGDELENLQFLCVQCNNIKAHACRHCPLGYQCERCTWAHPHEFLGTLVIELGEEMGARLKDAADVVGSSPNAYVLSMLIDRLEQN